MLTYKNTKRTHFSVPFHYVQQCILTAFLCGCVFFVCFFFTETPPPGYISEDGETSDQQMNQSMESGRLASVHAAAYLKIILFSC